MLTPLGGPEFLKNPWRLHVISDLKITFASYEDEVGVFFRSVDNSVTFHTLPASRMAGKVRANVTLQCI